MRNLEKISNINNQQNDDNRFIKRLPNDILVKVDRAAMNSSLETRVQLLDHKLIEYIWKIPHNLNFKMEKENDFEKNFK